MSSGLSLRPAGDRAVLVELEDNDAVHRLAAALQSRRGGELEEIVPGHQTLLLVWADQMPSRDTAAQMVDAAAGNDAELAAPPEVTLRVRYDGPDLEAVAGGCGISQEELATRHQACEYRAGFIGFSPGFAYLLGGDPTLQPPRLTEPRTRVPAGSLAIAGPYSAVYPRQSPGGWNLIGSCEESIFDAALESPALLAAGTIVRFVSE